MSATGWFCEHPDHVGLRLVALRANRFTLRTTYYREDGGQRLFEKNVPNGRRYRRCVHREADPVYNENQLFL